MNQLTQGGDLPVPGSANGGALPPDLPALGDRLRRVAQRVLRDPGDAEEVVQECLARFLEARRRGDIREPAAWLHRAVLNRAIDLARSHVRRTEHLRRYVREQRSRTPSAERALEREELRELVWRHLLELPRRPQQVVILREMEGLSYGEIAALLEIGEATARAHGHEAREILRRKLAAPREEHGE